MKNSIQTLPILMADDDDDDLLMARDALQEAKISNPFYTVQDGEELMDFLKHRGKYSKPEDSPKPGLILLDLNMPKKNGQEALQEIKDDPQLNNIPVVILTTSKDLSDISKSYNLSANSFITKPVNFDKLVEVMRTLSKYWFEIVQLPE